jgi:hypothetical protein
MGTGPAAARNPVLLKLKPSPGHGQPIINGESRIGYMTGREKARWIDVRLTPSNQVGRTWLLRFMPRLSG